MRVIAKARLILLIGLFRSLRELVIIIEIIPVIIKTPRLMPKLLLPKLRNRDYALILKRSNESKN
jgi:hypothetical protein